ncbi:hypothetical protein MNBD_BACTEROID01-2455 [hydrothermal vent metagenome]|uniref:histidine kinase n=1 Tax=hydrothermal vent metagenome TaxID=652676 RepID=A0A3B0U867_9ZZZZ
MNFKTIIFLKSKVVIVVLIFCVLAFGGIIFTFIRSLKLDREHVSLVEFSKNIEIEVFHSRIKLDDYFLVNDTSVNAEVLRHLQKAEDLASSINSFDETKIRDKKITRDFNASLTDIKVHIERLMELISLGSWEEESTIDSLIVKEYTGLQKTFLVFEKSIYDYVTKRDSNFKKEIFTLLILIFGFLILCLVLITRLINAYFLVEREYVEKSIEVEHKERKRIAADLHDGLGSLLSSIGLYTKLLEKEFISNDKVNDKLSQVKQLSDMALESLEDAINNLNPSILNKYGLIKSLEIICGKMNEIGNIYFHVESKDFNAKISKNTEITIYRICNELINNTLKHSSANEAKILFYNKKKKVFLRYSDNGIGFDPLFDYSANGGKTGLYNMIKRVESLGGAYSIKSGHGKGVNIFIRFNV